jgi:NTE family protein
MPTRTAKHLKWKAAAVLTAGAPTSPLMAGALAAIYEENRTYDWIFTSGSGSLIGLSLVAPKDKSPVQALRGLIDLTVADPVYKVAPIAHKVFFKAGPWSDMFRRLTPYYQIRQPTTSFGKTFNDWVSLTMSAAAPTNLTFSSKGLCNPNPWLEDFVDFEKLKSFNGGFTVNAYNITKAKMEYFEKNELTGDHLRAATACPFIYPPFRLRGSDYYEGADVDPINLPVLKDLAEDNVKVAIGKDGKPPKIRKKKDQLTKNVLRVDMRG